MWDEEDDEPAAGEGDEIPWGNKPDENDSEDKDKGVLWDEVNEDDDLDDALDNEEQERLLLDRAASVPCPACGGEFEGHKTRTGNLLVRCLSCGYECDV